MRYIKMLGLAAVAAAALMAFVGASTASATVLCKTTTNGAPTCPANQAYPAGTAVHAVSETKPVLTSFINVECAEATVQGTTDIEGEKGKPVTGKVSELKFIEPCNCAVKVLKNGSLSISWLSATNNGSLSSSGAEVTIECNTIFGKVHCIYETSSTPLGTLTGGEEATMDIESANIPRLKTDSLCAEKANWDVKFKVTTPKPLYMANET